MVFRKYLGPEGKEIDDGEEDGVLVRERFELYLLCCLPAFTWTWCLYH